MSKNFRPIAFFFTMVGLAVALHVAAPASAQSWGQFKEAATSAAEKGDLPGAEKYWQSALEIASQFSGQDPRFCIALKGLAEIYQKQKQFAQAHELYRRLIPAVESFAPRNDEASQCALAYCEFLKSQNHNDEAEKLAARIPLKASASDSQATSAASIARSLVAGEAATSNGADPKQAQNQQSIDVAKWSQSIATAKTAMKQKNFIVAEKAVKDALELTTLFSPTDPRLNQTWRELFNVYEVQGKTSSAEAALQNCIKLTRKCGGTNSSEYANLLVKDAQLLRKLDRKNDAIKQEQLAEQIQYTLALATTQSQAGDSKSASDPFRSITSISSAQNVYNGSSGGLNKGGAPPAIPASAEGQGPGPIAAEPSASAFSKFGRCKVLLFETSW